jgi:hypothetical protein
MNLLPCEKDGDSGDGYGTGRHGGADRGGSRERPAEGAECPDPRPRVLFRLVTLPSTPAGTCRWRIVMAVMLSSVQAALLANGITAAVIVFAVIAGVAWVAAMTSLASSRIATIPAAA